MPHIRTWQSCFSFLVPADAHILCSSNYELPNKATILRAPELRCTFGTWACLHIDLGVHVVSLSLVFWTVGSSACQVAAAPLTRQKRFKSDIAMICSAPRSLVKGCSPVKGISAKTAAGNMESGLFSKLLSWGDLLSMYFRCRRSACPLEMCARVMQQVSCIVQYIQHY